MGQHEPDATKKGGGRAQSVLSAVSSRSRVSIQSIMKTKQRKSSVTVTSQLSCTRSKDKGKRIILN